jgi:hypothetical protein
LQFNMGTDYLCRDVRISDCNFVGFSKGVELTSLINATSFMTNKNWPVALF